MKIRRLGRVITVVAHFDDKFRVAPFYNEDMDRKIEKIVLSTLRNNQCKFYSASGKEDEGIDHTCILSGCVVRYDKWGILKVYRNRDPQFKDQYYILRLSALPFFAEKFFGLFKDKTTKIVCIWLGIEWTIESDYIYSNLDFDSFSNPFQKPITVQKKLVKA